MSLDSTASMHTIGDIRVAMKAIALHWHAEIQHLCESPSEQLTNIDMTHVTCKI